MTHRNPMRDMLANPAPVALRWLLLVLFVGALNLAIAPYLPHGWLQTSWSSIPAGHCGNGEYDLLGRQRDVLEWRLLGPTFSYIDVIVLWVALACARRATNRWAFMALVAWTIACTSVHFIGMLASAVGSPDSKLVSVLVLVAVLELTPMVLLSATIRSPTAAVAATVLLGVSYGLAIANHQGVGVPSMNLLFGVCWHVAFALLMLLWVVDNRPSAHPQPDAPSASTTYTTSFRLAPRARGTGASCFRRKPARSAGTSSM